MKRVGKYRLTIVRVLLNVVFILLLTVSLSVCVRIASAATSISVTGTAQVQNTGSYIYFSEYNSNVTIASDTLQFSGNAWSDDLGWIAFGTVDNPSGPVVLNQGQNTITGKARIQNTQTDIEFDSSSESNVVLNSDGSLAGYAWTNELGWINFSGADIAGINSLLSTLLPDSGSQYRLSSFIFSLSIALISTLILIKLNVFTKNKRKV